jgi:hypothetical protein
MDWTDDGTILLLLQLLVYFLPILGGQKATVSDSVEGWCAAGNLGASRVSIRMDDRTDGQRDDGMDDWTTRCPDAFVTFTCNPQWLEIKRALLLG